MTDAEKRMEQAEQILVEAARELAASLRDHGATPSLTRLRINIEDALHDYDRAVLDV